jgi:CubicO group peptidase (beta-lactamase class C family)
LFRTRATTIVYRGKLIYERYKTVTARSPLMGWSMSKSLTGTLMGMLVAEGRIGLHDQVDIDQWQGNQRQNITYNNMLQMSSGILWTESFHLVLCLFVHVDCAKYYSELPPRHDPGNVFLYSSGNSYTLGFLVEKMRGQREINKYDWPRERLFRPMGMDNAVFEFVPHGYIAGGSMSYLNARDWARFGLLYYNRGNWFGNQLIPESWVDYACEQNPQSNWAYAAQWWRIYDHDPDGCIASGFRKQHVIVLPNRNVVLGRNAMPPLSLVFLWSQTEYLNRLMACFPPLEEEMKWNALNKPPRG